MIKRKLRLDKELVTIGDNKGDSLLPDGGTFYTCNMYCITPYCTVGCTLGCTAVTCAETCQGSNPCEQI